MTMMAFGQCRHVNSSMMSEFPLRFSLIGYLTATVSILDCILHCISLVITLHVQLQFKRGYEIPRPYVNT